jgi:hypothetical protein
VRETARPSRKCIVPSSRFARHGAQAGATEYRLAGTVSANQSLCFQAVADPDGLLQLAQKLLAAKPPPPA